MKSNHIQILKMKQGIYWITITDTEIKPCHIIGIHLAGPIILRAVCDIIVKFSRHGPNTFWLCLIPNHLHMRTCNEGYPKPSLKQDGEMMHLGCRSATRCLQMASKHQLGLPGCSLVYWKVQRMSAWLHGFVLASMESHLALSPELPLHLPSHSLGGDFSPISHFEKFAWGSHWGYFILSVEVFS